MNKKKPQEIQFLAELIQKQFDHWALPFKLEFRIPEHYLIPLLMNMKEKERVYFVDIFFSFFHYCNVIKPAIDIKNRDGIWTNFILLLLFGLIEASMREYDYKDLYSYLKSIKNRKRRDVDEMLDEWRMKYGANEVIRIFFESYMKKVEQKMILESIKSDPRWAGINSIETFVNRIIKYRNEFVHRLSIQGMPGFSGIGSFEDLENKKIIWYSTISIEEITRFVLFGVFRKFDTNRILPLW